ncbi:MAG: alpha/beta hydrolase, partial [Actinomycetota bacterium]|nr:alpha/beta hydrolase [Actinomycetota bacterium]
VAVQAGFLKRWLVAVGIQRAVFVGHDLGGGVAQIVAVRHPELCAGLVLTNAISYDSWPIPSVKALRSMGGLVKRMPSKMFRAVFSAFLSQGHDDPETAADSVAAHWPHYDHEGGSLAFVRQLRSLDVNDTQAISDLLPDLQVPGRIVWGAADRFQKITYGRRLAADLRAELDAIDQGKHFTPEDHPDRVAAAVNIVVKECANG